jgi:hypothetical protein
LKPEAERSLFPQLIDRNEKHQPVIFRASSGCNVVTYSCCAEYGAFNAGRRQTRRTKRAVKNSPGSGRENVIVEVVTPIALVDNAFGRLSSLQRPLGDAAANVE